MRCFLVQGSTLAELGMAAQTPGFCKGEEVKSNVASALAESFTKK